MALSKGFQFLALKLQEQATSELSQGDLRRWLECACKDLSKDGHWCYLVDIFGDSESGDVIVSMDGDLKRCPYQVTQTAGKSAATIDFEVAEEVLPRTSYEPEADESDSMASLEAAVRESLYTEIPLYERFIPNAERKAADSGSFAGKGRSFPILKPSDVMAAVRALSRAGKENFDPATIKRNIIRIAKAKGWEREVPKAWREAAASETAELELTGDVIPLREGAVTQDGTAYLKLISPGRGSSGFYPAEVLKRDGPKVFPEGTKNFWNHQTPQEEAARPEGSLNDLASVLTEDAHYEENGPAGPGLYARAKVFEHFRGPVDSLAKHIGMSIRANGKAREGKAPDGKTGPIIEQLTKGVSVDYVTTPGAGGKILQLFEAARVAPANSTEEGGAEDMVDAAEFQKLKESAAAAEKRLATAEAEARKLRERMALSDARGEVAAYFGTVRVSEAIQTRVTGRLMAGTIPLTETGELDVAKFKPMIEAEAKDELAYVARLGGDRTVVGMGAVPDADPKKIAESFDAALNDLAATMGLSESARKTFREGRVA